MTNRTVTVLTCLPVAVAAAVLTATAIPPQGVLSEEADGESIATEVERIHQGFATEEVELTLVQISADGGRSERRLRMEILEDLDEGNWSRIDVESPANVRGTVLLTHARGDADDDQWLYLPAARRVRRVSAGNRTGSFMGSEFTYEDLVPPLTAHYTHTRLDDGMLDGRACYRLERRPRSGESGYTRQVIWIDREHLIPRRIEYYDRRNELLKVASYSDYSEFEEHRRPGTVRVENLQTGRASELVASSRALGVSLNRNRFRSDALAP